MSCVIRRYNLNNQRPQNKRKSSDGGEASDSQLEDAEDPRIGEAYTALQAAIAKKRDEFDAYGEYIANVLRSMDKPTRAFVKKEFSDIIFKAESGIYTSPSAIIQSS
ncbi:uncharacterized protein LOC111873875 isoform X2 [Cryptotermes secundus]|uniref:uncharacterized protein LOC111873875 isoform X2 n=1 Tax=Cryptotermes secundus TaxID=105785 RepID=UPI000CD7B5C9|nr:uncharacterized protein LOC111873875 isoform X2 [Cryptotermes secundus]